MNAPPRNQLGAPLRDQIGAPLRNQISAPLREVVIVGRDAPLWLSACVMQQALGPAGVTVTAIELPARAQASDVHATLPALEPLHTRLRIEEARLIAATRGAFTLGRNFVDAGGAAPAFFHPHGSVGTRIDRKEFLAAWTLARRMGLSLPFEEFSLTAAAAKRGRMLLPDSEIESFGFTDYAYHLPAIPYAAWLRQLASRREVRVHEARSVTVHRREDGGIAALQLEDDRRVAGDFFLDVSGEDALLAGGALGVARDSWRDDFPADRVLSAHAAPLAPLPAYSEVRACAGGWVGLIASQACTHVMHAFNSEYTSEAAALEAATRTTGMTLQGPGVQSLDPGIRARAWEHNCVAIGAAACVFDPLHWLELHAVQVSLVHLLPLFPVAAEFTVERAEYNKNVRAAFQRMRDFQAAHYLLNRYGASPFWSRARQATPGEDLAHKIDLFRARGAMADYEDEAFTPDEWQSLLIGHGVIPEGYDPAVERTPPELLEKELTRLLEFIRRKVDEQVPHGQYLQSLCAPTAPLARRP